MSSDTERERTSLSRRENNEKRQKSTGDVLNERQSTSVDLTRLLATTESAQTENDE
jgi:hypothetical protein